MKAYIINNVGGENSLLFGGYTLPPRCSRSERVQNTRELNAVINVLVKQGIRNIYIHEGQPVHLETMDEHARIIRNSKELLLDRSFAMLLLLNQRPCNAGIGGITVNRRYHFVSEIGLYILMAGYYGIPTLFVSGEARIVKDIQKLNGKIRTLVLRPRTRNIPGTCQGVTRALTALATIPPVTLKGHVQIEVKVTAPSIADKFSGIEGVKRSDAVTVKFQANTIIDAYAIYRCLGMALQASGYGRVKG